MSERIAKGASGDRARRCPYALRKSKLPDFKKGAITTKLWLRSFFATCYPTGEDEGRFLKTMDTHCFAARDERAHSGKRER